jgi:hypothetical protein
LNKIKDRKLVKEIITEKIEREEKNVGKGEENEEI